MLLCFELVSNVTPFLTNLKCSATGIGEGFQKQKWKFKMAFAMKRGRHRALDGGQFRFWSNLKVPF